MNEWICRKKAGKGFAFSRCGWLADYDSHKLTKRPKASLGSCPLPTRLPRNQRSTAAPPRPPERVRKYCLAGKPEALVIPPPRACVPAPARTSYTRSSSENVGPRTRHSRVLAGRAPHPAAHAFWAGPAASRRGDGTGFLVFFPLLPPLLFPPATYGSAALARLVGCVRLARPAQLSSARLGGGRPGEWGPKPPSDSEEPAAATQRPGRR